MEKASDCSVITLAEPETNLEETVDFLLDIDNVDFDFVKMVPEPVWVYFVVRNSCDLLSRL
jgi:hypothetical protein